MSHASNDDFNAFGVTGRGIVTDYRPWATRVSPSHERRWEFLQKSVSDEGFYSGIELKNLTTLMCGVPQRQSSVGFCNILKIKDLAPASWW